MSAHSTRLDDLLDLRRKIDAEITKERAFLARVACLKKHAATHVIVDRDGWIDRTVRAVSAAYYVTVEEVTGRGRSGELIAARHIIAWLLRQRGLSYPEIGRVLGRDHTTAMHSVKRVNASRELREAAGDLGAQALDAGARGAA